MAYKISDFQTGDQVYHLSNSSTRMVIIEINTELNEVLCRWIDKAGKIQSQRFMAEELGKTDDLRPIIMSL